MDEPMEVDSTRTPISTPKRTPTPASSPLMSISSISIPLPDKPNPNSTSTSSPAENTDFNTDSNVRNVFGCGNNINGELGFRLPNKEEDTVTDPVIIDAHFPSPIVSIACGEYHTIFVLEDGNIFSCGSNDHGQLGHDSVDYREGYPQKVEGLEGRFIVNAAAGHAHTMAIDNWGTVYAFGSDSHGQLGLLLDPHQDRLIKRPRLVKSLANKVVVQVACGQFHSLFLTNAGEIYTCGSNSHGQLGLGIVNGLNQTKPFLVQYLVGFPVTFISAGGFHSFALSISGSVYSWGKNNHGQLGLSSTDDKCQPTQVKSLRSLNCKYIVAGVDHTAFLTADGGVFTCGNGMYGQLGHSNTTNEVLPRKILEFGTVVYQIACGNCNTLCLTQKAVYNFGLPTGTKISHLNINGLKSPIHSIYSGGDQLFILESNKNDELNCVINNGPSSSSSSLNSSTSTSNSSVIAKGIVCDYRKYNKERQVLTITLDIIDKLCSAKEPVDQEIMKMAEILFASPSIWNKSFLLPNEQHVPCTWKKNGIDVPMAEKCLLKLKNIKSSSLKELIDHLLYNELLPKLPHTVNLEFMRVYVLLPMTHNFSTNLGLLIAYTQRILCLDNQLFRVVVKWLYETSVENLISLISAFKRAIISVLDQKNQSKAQKDQILTVLLTFLRELNSINKVSLKLSYHTFTIPTLINKVEVKSDYYNWLQEKNKRREDSNGGRRPFYFCDYPFVFCAQAKTLVLQTDQYIQMQDAINKATTEFYNSFILAPLIDPQHIQFLHLNVSRKNIVQDTINQLFQLNTQDLKKPLKVKLLGEDAEDAGGVVKEFFLLLMKEILDAKYGMFKYYEETRLIWFNDYTFEDNVMYLLIGLLCGLAIYNKIIINLPFPLALYKKITSDEKVELNDLKELSPQVAKSLEQILDYEGDDFEDVFGMTFEISRESFGEVKVIPLKEGGAKIGVSQENKAEFVDLYINYIFNTSVQAQFEAFRKGFLRVCGGNVLKLFQAQELQAMITGNEDYDWGELERNCTYKGIYHANDSTIKLFWEVFHSLTIEEKKQFLLFLTGCDRIPILGMKNIKMCIQPINDDKHFPAAHVCFNLLDLPRYQTKERLRYKLLTAIQHSEGFTLV